MLSCFSENRNSSLFRHPRYCQDYSIFRSAGQYSMHAVHLHLLKSLLHQLRHRAPYDRAVMHTPDIQLFYQSALHTQYTFEYMYHHPDSYNHKKHSHRYSHKLLLFSDSLIDHSVLFSEMLLPPPDLPFLPEQHLTDNSPYKSYSDQIRHWNLTTSLH